MNNEKSGMRTYRFRRRIWPVLMAVALTVPGCYLAGDNDVPLVPMGSGIENGRPASVLERNASSTASALRPGDTITMSKTVTITRSIPKADILFVFDLTGSMRDELTQMQQNAIAIMNDLDTLISDARYGVISFKDYTKTYSSCNYSAPYGAASDYPYSLDRNLTNDKALLQSTINGLTIGNGYDGPESYTRALYEAYSDPGITYREGSRKILIVFGDNVPHDCNINEGVPGVSGVRSTGIDPGRDGIVNTADDLDLQVVLQGLVDRKITMLSLFSGINADYTLWKHWTGLTGGTAYQLGASSDIPAAIKQIIEGEVLHLDELTLKVTTPGYEGWLTSVTPVSYTDIDITGTMEFTFDYVLTVPANACDGVDGSVTHEFTLSVIGDGATYGEEDVAVTVQCDDPMDYFNVKILMASHKVWCGHAMDHLTGLGALRLADSGDAFDPDNDAVVMTINDVEISIPAGSFRKAHWFCKNSANVFTYNGKIPGLGHVAMTLNFKMGFWHIMVDGKDVSSLVASDTVSVMLEIGSNVGSDGITWTKKWKTGKSQFAKYIEKKKCHKK